MRVEEFRDLLMEQRRQVLDRIGWLEENQRDAVGSTQPESVEIAQASLQEDLMLHLDERSRDQILAIHAALDRIRRGDYGICEICGEPIPEARLRASPTATTHVECAEERRREEDREGAPVDESGEGPDESGVQRPKAGA